MGMAGQKRQESGIEGRKRFLATSRYTVTVKQQLSQLSIILHFNYAEFYGRCELCIKNSEGLNSSVMNVETYNIRYESKVHSINFGRASSQKDYAITS